MAAADLCQIDGCDNPSDRRGWCTKHYMRWRRNGDPEHGRSAPGSVTDFVMNVALTYQGDDCLLWPNGAKRTNYVSGRFEGRHRLAHRYVCEKVHGTPPSPGHQAAHWCGVRNCINPQHLSWKTPLENEADKIRHGTKLYGQKSPNALLSDEEATAVKVLRGRLPTATISEIFHISRQTVYAIQSGRLRKQS